MRKYKIDLSEEKHILCNMITNTSFLQQVKDICKTTLFETSHSRIVCEWVWEYYEKTQSAPGRDIQDLYKRKRAQIHNEEDLELISEFLSTLSKYYETAKINNVDYELHKAEQYFKLRSLEQLCRTVEKTVDDRVPEIGEKYVSEYRRIEKQTGEGVDLLRDSKSI